VNPVTVSALTTHIVALLERDELLRDVLVLGEISNWKRAASGHCYFSLKDSGATISVVMWRNAASMHSWLPRDGDQVIVHGYVSVYPERGAYQLYANRMMPAGRGQLYEQFEKLKARLQAEGLFDFERKRPVPTTANRIGVVTSPSAAALQDILRVLRVRWPVADVIVFPTLVQGSDAPPQIVAALKAANEYSREVERLDALILARGGGSIEDLWAFNDEGVAYAVAASEVPVVTGVGHETDYTIVDFVADARAPTPTAAAAAITPDRDEMLAQVENVMAYLQQSAERAVDALRDEIAYATHRLERLHPQRQLDLRRQTLDERERRLQMALQSRIVRKADRLQGALRRLDALNPVAVMGRGYSIVQRADGTVVTDPAVVAAGETLRVQASKGSYRVTRVS
jgi:exodeoxyribonuclease VII large subunit